MTLDKSRLQENFAAVQARWNEHTETDPGLVCRQGSYKNCHVVKLQKASWTNDDMGRLENESGIFFSVWIDAEDATRNRAQYNIHALKLRQLRGYAISSRDFANEFRASFASMQSAWPNVSVAYGPQTLMQGWIDIDERSCGASILSLMLRFAEVAPLIDRLLQQRRR